MSNDLEAFLRQAAERRKQRQEAKQGQGTSSAGQAPIPIPAGRARPQEPIPSSIPPSANQRRFENEYSAPVIIPEVVSDLSSKHLPTQSWRSNVPQESHLAQRVGRADEKVQAHVKSVFEHRVGRLTKQSATSQLARVDLNDTSSIDRPAVSQDRSSEAAKNLLQMLRDPKTLKAAFVASEIFQRKF